MNLKEDAWRMIQAAIEAVKPHRLIGDQVRREGDVLYVREQPVSLPKTGRLVVVGFGKASAAMAQALEPLVADTLSTGLVITKYGHGVLLQRIEVVEAGHPLLDENGLQGTRKLLHLVEPLTEGDVVICLISGGGSALLEALPTGITLNAMQKTVQLLLKSGATIEEINAVRKHLSLVKGGQLARRIAPARCVSLIISDVIGDPLDAIASGPTAPDSTTFQDAVAVLQRYRIWEQVPESVREWLTRGTKGAVPETVKADDPLWERVHNIILGNNHYAVTRAQRVAETLGYHTLVLTSRLQGEAREVARVMAAIAQSMQQDDYPLTPPAAIIFGGETTVTVRGNGKGGRNQELALAALIAMGPYARGYLIASVGTDGTDGPTDAAGGWAYPGIWRVAENRRLNPLDFLANNDSYHFFKQVDGLVVTGPTGTNVMDIGVILVDGTQESHAANGN